MWPFGLYPRTHAFFSCSGPFFLPGRTWNFHKTPIIQSTLDFLVWPAFLDSCGGQHSARPLLPARPLAAGGEDNGLLARASIFAAQHDALRTLQSCPITVDHNTSPLQATMLSAQPTPWRNASNNDGCTCRIIGPSSSSTARVQKCRSAGAMQAFLPTFLASKPKTCLAASELYLGIKLDARMQACPAVSVACLKEFKPVKFPEKSAVWH